MVDIWEKVAIASSSAVLTAIVAYILQHRKYKSEINKLDIEAIYKAIEIWKESVEELKAEREQLIETREMLDKENKILREQKEMLMAQNKKIMQALETIKNK